MAIVLHFGFPKTGTTFLQQVFKNNSKLLQRHNIVYPLVGKDFKQRALKHLTAKHIRGDVNNELYNLETAVSNKLSQNPKANILFSVEEISSPMMSDVTVASLKKLKDFLWKWDKDVRLIAYVRRPEDFFLSIMQEKLKRSGGIIPPQDFRSHFSQIIGNYEEAFETKAIVRPFDKQQWFREDLLVDFLNQLKDMADITSDELELPEQSSNESLSAEVMFILDLLRKFPGSLENIPEYSFPESERLWRKLRDIEVEAKLSIRPKLFKDVALAIIETNKIESSILLKKYNIQFQAKSEFSDDIPLPATIRLSEVEGIIPVNRDHAFRILSVFCARENAASFASYSKR